MEAELPQHLDGSGSRTWRPKYLIRRDGSERRPVLIKCQQDFHRVVIIVGRAGSTHPALSAGSSWQPPKSGLRLDRAAPEGLGDHFPRLPKTFSECVRTVPSLRCLCHSYVAATRLGTISHFTRSLRPWLNCKAAAARLVRSQMRWFVPPLSANCSYDTDPYGIQVNFFRNRHD